MPLEDEGDNEAPGPAPLPPEDRLWRHPSELASTAAQDPLAAEVGSPVATPVASRWWGLVAAGLAGAGLSLGAVLLTGMLTNRSGERVTTSSTRVPSTTQVSLSNRSTAGNGVSDLVRTVNPSIAGVRVSVGSVPRIGSAVVLGPVGHLVTSAGLVEGATKVSVSFANGTTTAATIAGTDPLTGLAVLRVSGATLAPAQLAARRPAVGSLAVMVAGSTNGGSGLVSAGIVRGTGQRASTSTGQLHDLIELDQEPAPEANGGAVVGADGSVIGIGIEPSADPTDEASQAGWAVPIDVAAQVANDISTDGHAHHVWLGVEIANAGDLPSFTPTDEQGDDGDQGAVIASVSATSPAQQGGLQAGDRVTEVGGTKVASMADLISILRRHRPGDRVQVSYTRDHQAHTVSVRLREQPPDA